MILGITGPSGAGKTTLLRLLERRGGYVIDCDRLYGQLLESGGEMTRALQAQFPEAFDPRGQLNRAELAQRVFQDPAQLRLLNEIVYFYLPREVRRRIEQLPPGTLIGIDAVNLAESGLARLCDRTVAVTAPAQLRLQRIMQRDGLSRQQAQQRLQAQGSSEDYARGCHAVLVNDCATAAAFERKAEQFLDRICKEEAADGQSGMEG